MRSCLSRARPRRSAVRRDVLRVSPGRPPRRARSVRHLRGSAGLDADFGDPRVPPAADVIRDVVEPGGEVAVVLLIEAEASELCADLPEGGEATAKLSLLFRVFAPASGATPERELLRKTYSRTRPLAARDSAAIADAWNRESSEIADAFLADLRPLLPPAP